jgi:hypothetical protein
MPLFAKGQIPVDIKQRVLIRWPVIGGSVIVASRSISLGPVHYKSSGRQEND